MPARYENLLMPAELKSRLLDVGAERYHHKHPFHRLMHKGELTREQLQAWALNRYYYQSKIPRKDALILARSDDPAFRRAWRKRIIDHDGQDGGAFDGGGTPGGIEKWIRLAEATGLSQERVVSEREILPGVRYAVDAYLDLVTKRSHLEAVASSLTELFSRDLISLRIILHAHRRLGHAADNISHEMRLADVVQHVFPERPRLPVKVRIVPGISHVALAVAVDLEWWFHDGLVFNRAAE